MQNDELAAKIEELVAQMKQDQEKIHAQQEIIYAREARPHYVHQTTSTSPANRRHHASLRTKSDSPNRINKEFITKGLQTSFKRHPSQQEVFTFRERSPRQQTIQARIKTETLSTVKSHSATSPTATLIRSAKEVSERQRDRSPIRSQIAKDWNPFLQEVKSNLFDLVSEFRDKWAADAHLKKEYDQLIKHMVLLSLNQPGDDAEGEEPILKVIQLIQQVVGVFKQNLEYQNSLQSKVGAEVEEQKHELTHGERDLRKRIDIVHNVFKKASEKLTRIDREWQEVVDSQVYIIEELIADPDQAEVNVRKDKGLTPLDTAINDFQFTLGKAIESLVTQENFDKTISHKVQFDETGNSVGTMRDAEYNRILLQQLFDVYDDVLSARPSTQSTVNLKITNVGQFRSYSVRMIKALREDLAKIQSEHVK